MKNINIIKIFLLLICCGIITNVQAQQDTANRDLYFSVMKEKDITKKEALLQQFLTALGADSSEGAKRQRNALNTSMAWEYIEAGDAPKFEMYASRANPEVFAFGYQAAAKKLLEKGVYYDYAEKFAHQALMGHLKGNSRRDVSKDSAMAAREKVGNGSYVDLYAYACYMNKDYAAGYPYAKEAALDIAGGMDWSYNEHYALLIAKVLPPAKAKPELEKLINTGMLTEKGKGALKEVYVALNKSDKGYAAYLAGLEKSVVSKGKEELEKVMISKPAPDFSLVNLAGEKVSLASLKGKTVVIDFWATWCLPCVSAFPAMQRVVDRYKDNKNVVILFIDTKEPKESDKDKVVKFMQKEAFKKFTFNILLDQQSTVSHDFEVKGIPAKFIIDPKGNIRFTTMGYDGKEDGLVEELSMMIEMAAAI